MLAGWFSPTHDRRSQDFALQLRDIALHFHTTLSQEQQANFDLLWDAFRQKYTTTVGFLTARLKAAGQQCKQEIANFFCSLRTLARRIYHSSHYIIDRIVFTSLVEGLKSPTLCWELTEARTGTVEKALTLAIELNSFISVETAN